MISGVRDGHCTRHGVGDLSHHPTVAGRPPSMSEILCITNLNFIVAHDSNSTVDMYPPGFRVTTCGYLVTKHRGTRVLKPYFFGAKSTVDPNIHAARQRWNKRRALAKSHAPVNGFHPGNKVVYR